MKLRILGVRAFPVSKKFYVIFDNKPISTEKCITYGANPYDKPIWCSNFNLLEDCIKGIGKLVDVDFDLNRNISAVHV